MTVLLGGAARLSCAEISAIAYRSADVELDPTAIGRAEVGRAVAERIAGSRPVYGRDTGVGANRGVALNDATVAALPLLRSHATSAGPPRSPMRVRAMLAIRLHQLGQGGSGVAPTILESLLSMLVLDALPAVLEYGSIGTGDLSALATTALALLGEAPTAVPFDRVTPFGEHDALAFISSNAATLADAALGCAALQPLTEAALGVAALTFSALRGNPEAFDPPVLVATPFAGAARVCAVMRALSDPSAEPARIQDPFGLRTLPQVHGVILDSLAALESVVEALMSAPTENPVFTAPSTVTHHGGFQFAYLSTSLDTAASALAQSAQLVQARLAALLDPDISGLPPFLAGDGAGMSGLMVTEYVAAAALSELRAASTPVAVQSISVSRGAEEDASFASLGAGRLHGLVAAYRVMLSCELVAAHRAIVMQRGTPTGFLGDLFAIAGDISDDVADRDLTTDLASADSCLDRVGQLVASVG
jgi:histidine ammonia-lyase